MKVTVEQIVEAIREAGDKGILAVELAEKLNVSTPCINNRVPKIIRMTPNLIRRTRERTSATGHSYRYFCVEQETQEEVPEENTNKNAEGYCDPTAGSAIEKVDADNRLTPGYIYKRFVSGSLFLVMDIEEDSIVGYNVEENYNHTDGTNLVEWFVDGTYYLVRYHRVASANPRSLGSYVDACPVDTLSTILQHTPIQIGKIHFQRGYKLYTEKDVLIKVNEAVKRVNDMFAERRDQDRQEFVKTCTEFRKKLMDALCVDPDTHWDDAMELVKSHRMAFDEGEQEIEELREAYTKELDMNAAEIKRLNDQINKYESSLHPVPGIDTNLIQQRAEIYEKVYRDLIDILSARTRVSMNSNGLTIKN